KRGVCPNTAMSELAHSSSKEFYLTCYPLFMASLSDNPSIVDTLLRFDAQWEVDGTSLGEELQSMSVMYTPTNIPKALPHALSYYQKHKQSLLLRHTLEATLFPPIEQEENTHRKM